MMNRHVLVVEDDESSRETLVDYLTQESRLEVDGARDGVDALHHILMTDYEVVILDMMMPKMSGGDVLDSVQAMTSDPSLALLQKAPAIIIVTGAAEDDLPDSTIRQRFSHLVRRIFRKPVDCAELASAVEREISH
jgi:CheY-like chemotaxis protein